MIQALTHSSFSNEKSGTLSEKIFHDNERLEFLGDAVLGLYIARTLMDLFPDASEGKLSKFRSGLVSRKTLAEIAQSLNLGQWLFLGKGELRSGGATKSSILAATFEAVVGSIYLDGGVDRAFDFLQDTFTSHLLAYSNGGESLSKLLDRKTHLQERVQSTFKATPTYRLVESWGPEHAKEFRVEIVVDGKVVATGEGKSKKEAEQHAASIALEVLGL